jgi:hypothetical protein
MAVTMKQARTNHSGASPICGGSHARHNDKPAETPLTQAASAGFTTEERLMFLVAALLVMTYAPLPPAWMYALYIVTVGASVVSIVYTAWKWLRDYRAAKQDREGG